MKRMASPLDDVCAAHQFVLQTSLGCDMPTRETAVLDRINAVTANFFFWQGLRWIPLGVALLVAAWSSSHSSPVPESWRSTLFIATMTVALVVSAMIGRWYGRSFGRVRGIPGQHARRTRTKWLVVYPALVVALLVDMIAKPPVLVTGITFAAAIEAYRRSTGGGRRHYIIASIAFAALTFAPTLRLATPGVNALNLLVALLGVCYTIGGLLDHRELKRLFPDPNDTDTPRGAVAGVGGAR